MPPFEHQVSAENFPELNPVFFDKKGHRRRFVNYLTFILTALFTIVAGFFVVSVLVNPFLPQLRLKPSAIPPPKARCYGPASVTTAAIKKRSLAAAGQRTAKERKTFTRRVKTRESGPARHAFVDQTGADAARVGARTPDVASVFMSTGTIRAIPHLNKTSTNSIGSSPNGSGSQATMQTRSLLISTTRR